MLEEVLASFRVRVIVKPGYVAGVPHRLFYVIKVGFQLVAFFGCVTFSAVASAYFLLGFGDFVVQIFACVLALVDT